MSAASRSILLQIIAENIVREWLAELAQKTPVDPKPAAEHTEKTKNESCNVFPLQLG